MSPKTEAWLRRRIAGLINDGIAVEAFSEDGVQPDDPFVWEIVKVVRNATIREVKFALADIALRD